MSGKGWHPFEWRVRYNETDQMGVVYHAHYLSWFEIGRTEWIRAQGFTYRGLEERGILLPLVEAELKFKQPARYDDQVTIYTKLIEHSYLRLHFACEIRRRGAASPSIAPTTPPPQGNPLISAVHLQEPVETLGESAGELLVSGVSRHVWVNRSWKPIRIDKAAPEVYRVIAGR